MDAKEIIQLLEGPSDNRIVIKGKILHQASIEQLIAAMHEPKTRLTYAILCELLGKRKDAQAVPVLLAALRDADSSIRAEAAQALAKIESPVAGEPLLAQYLIEEDKGAKEWEIIALGAVGYRPAISQLIQALDVEHLRRYAALALGELKAKEARAAVQQALASEIDPYTVKLMKEALKALED
jgi:HEAT repeat protein